MSDTTDIGELIRSRLADARSIANLVDGRIRPGHLGKNETLPAITYEMLASDSQMHLKGASGYAFSRLQINSYGATYRQSNQVAAAVVDVLHGFYGMLGSVRVDDCMLDNKYDRRDPPPPGGKHWRFRRVQDFKISHTEPIPSLSTS